MSKIQVMSDGTLQVPAHVEVPFVTGDGIGHEVTPAMRQVVDQAVQQAYGGERRIVWQEQLAGQRAFDELGTWLPEDTVKAFADCGVGIKGPLTTPVGGGIRSLNVALRQGLDLYVCLRPVRWFKGVASPVLHPEKVDMVIFRENTEDIYAGIEWPSGSPEAQRLFAFLHEELGVGKVRFPQTSAYGIKPVSSEGSKRLVRAACRYAVAQRSGHVTLVHKGNIMKFTEGGFKNWGYEVAKEEFDGQVRMDDCIADAFLQNALLYPDRYDVIATLNLNGDYISDALAAQVGGIGIAPGGNINYTTGHAIFEATHGTAPKYANLDKVNPGSVILSGEMMFRYLGWNEVADLIIKGLEDAIGAKVVTYDLARLIEGSTEVKCSQFADEIIKHINK